MVTTLSAESSQGFPPIPAICQKVDFTGDREPEPLKHLFNQLDFGSKGTTSLGSFGMIEFGPVGQKEVLIKESKEDPLVAKDMGFSSPILMPATSGHRLACLFGNGVIHDKKEDGVGFDPQMTKELRQSDLCNFLHGPDVFSKESSKTAKRSAKKGMSEGLNHGGSMSFFARLNEADDKGRENFERRS
jgi:hypothetical protein